MQFERKRKPKEKPRPSSTRRTPAPELPPEPDTYKAPPAGRAGEVAKGVGHKSAFSFLYRPDGKLDIKLVSLISALGGGIVLVLMLIGMALLLPSCQQAPALSGSGLSLAGSSVVVDQSYDKAKNSLPQGEFAGTLLEETEDAGETYMEETLFLGDSNTVRLVEFGAGTGLTLQNGFGVVGQAIQGAVQNNNIIFQGYNNVTMAKSVALMQPRRVVINFGTNNVGFTSVEAFIESYKTFIEQIREAYPAADIIVAAVLPIAQQHQGSQLSQGEVDKYNRALVELAQQEDAKFLNWSEALKDENSGYARAGTMEKDGFHVSRAAAEDLLKYFRTHSYVGEDTRPKPLKTVPFHIQTPAPVVSSSSSKEAPPSVSASSSPAPLSVPAPPSSTSSTNTTPPPPASSTNTTPPPPASSTNTTPPPAPVPPAPEPAPVPPAPEPTPVPPAVAPPPPADPGALPPAGEAAPQQEPN